MNKIHGDGLFMKVRRFIPILLTGLLLNCLLVSFGFGADDTGKSGLDLDRGYDVNTVTSVSGRVVSLPKAGQPNTMFEIRQGSESLTVVIGPGSFWEEKGIPIHLDDEITVKGSQAQGRDGKLYILTRTMTNETTGGQWQLRNERGEPAWQRRNTVTRQGERPDAGFRRQGTMIMRGGGMRR